MLRVTSRYLPFHTWGKANKGIYSNGKNLTYSLLQKAVDKRVREHILCNTTVQLVSSFTNLNQIALPSGHKQQRLTNLDDESKLIGTKLQLHSGRYSPFYRVSEFSQNEYILHKM